MEVRLIDTLNFEAQKVKNNCVQWIKDWFKENGSGCNCVVGISGGKDSSVVAALCVEALGRERVIGVTMPDGEQEDIQDSLDLIHHLGIQHIDADVSFAIDGVFHSLIKELGTISVQAETNLPPRIRMTTLYVVAQTLNGRVANTCNLSEDYVGYSTRYGDGAGDFSPLANLTVAEIIAVGNALGLPEHLLEKAPADGLCGKTDEDNLGFSYAVLDKYIRTGICEDKATKKKIDELHRKNEFKLKLMPSFYYSPSGAPENTEGLI